MAEGQELSAEELAKQIVEDGFSNEGLRNRIEAELSAAEERGYRQGLQGRAETISRAQAIKALQEIVARGGVVCGKYPECGSKVCQNSVEVYLLAKSALEAERAAEPTEWDDLKHMEGRALRESLRDRAYDYKWAAYQLEDLLKGGTYNVGKPNVQILIDQILAMELKITQEEEKLWDEEKGRETK